MQELVAFRNFNWDPAEYWYPPLYPFLAAIIGFPSTGHPFFLLDLICFLFFCFVFWTVAKKYVSHIFAAALVTAGLLVPFTLFENHVIPWTTSLSGALLSCGVLFLFQRREAFTGKKVNLRLVTAALALGLVTPTRPLDSFIALVLMAGVVQKYVSASKAPGKWLVVSISAAAYALAAGSYLIFNQLIFGNFLGTYFSVGAGNGYYLDDLFEKFFSLVIDGSLIYGPEGQSIAQNLPWVVLTLPPLIFVFASRLRNEFGFVSLAIIVTFALYLPYGDLLPTGLWKYLNIHYFKWTFPYLLLIAFVTAREIRNHSRGRDLLKKPKFYILVGLFLSLFGLQGTTHALVETPAYLTSPVQLKIEAVRVQEDVDFIELPRVTGDWNDIYFGQHSLAIGDQRLLNVRDFRLVPGTSGIRLVFVRPQRINARMTLDFENEPRLTGPMTSATFHTYEFKVLGLPLPIK